MDATRRWTYELFDDDILFASSSAAPIATLSMVCAVITVNPRIGGSVRDYPSAGGSPDGAPRVVGSPELVKC